MTAAVVVEDVSKRFRLYQSKPQSLKERAILLGRARAEEFWALRDVSLEVAQGETFGLLGHNGSGKSTLLKCVAGTLRPTRGRVALRGRVAALLELGAGFHPELTGRENVYLNGSILGFSERQIDGIFDSIVEFAEIEPFIDQQVKHYSSGMYARLGFAVAINVDPDVLLVDEVLSVGDEAFQRKCIDRIKRFQHEGRTIVLVTHAADQVRVLCDRAAVLDRGRLIVDGAPNDAVRAFREALAERGIEVAEHYAGRHEQAGRAGRRLAGDVRFTSVRLECPQGRAHLRTGDGLSVRIAYEAARDVPDCIFAIELHDQDGMRLLGTNTEHLGLPLGVRAGAGEIVFRIESVPLLDGMYAFSVGIHDTQGVEFDHRDQLDKVAVESPGRLAGRVAFPITVEHHAAGAPGVDRAAG